MVKSDYEKELKQLTFALACVISLIVLEGVQIWLQDSYFLIKHYTLPEGIYVYGHLLLPLKYYIGFGPFYLFMMLFSWYLVSTENYIRTRYRIVGSLIFGISLCVVSSFKDNLPSEFMIPMFVITILTFCSYRLTKDM